MNRTRKREHLEIFEVRLSLKSSTLSSLDSIISRVRTLIWQSVRTNKRGVGLTNLFRSALALLDSYNYRTKSRRSRQMWEETRALNHLSQKFTLNSVWNRDILSIHLIPQKVVGEYPTWIISMCLAESFWEKRASHIKLILETANSWFV